MRTNSNVYTLAGQPAGGDVLDSSVPDLHPARFAAGYILNSEECGVVRMAAADILNAACIDRRRVRIAVNDVLDAS